MTRHFLTRRLLRHPTAPRRAPAAHPCSRSSSRTGAVLAQQPRPVVLLDRIVAVVNNDVITRGDLEERYRFANLQLDRQGTPLPPRDVLEKQILDRLITDRVQLQLAKETGLRVDDAELDRAINRIAQDNKSHAAAIARGAGQGRRAVRPLPRGHPQ